MAFNPDFDFDIDNFIRLQQQAREIQAQNEEVRHNFTTLARIANMPNVIEKPEPILGKVPEEVPKMNIPLAAISPRIPMSKEQKFAQWRRLSKENKLTLMTLADAIANLQKLINVATYHGLEMDDKVEDLKKHYKDIATDTINLREELVQFKDDINLGITTRLQRLDDSMIDRINNVRKDIGDGLTKINSNLEKYKESVQEENNFIRQKIVNHDALYHDVQEKINALQIKQTDHNNTIAIIQTNIRELIKEIHDINDVVPDMLNDQKEELNKQINDINDTLNKTIELNKNILRKRIDDHDQTLKKYDTDLTNIRKELNYRMNDVFQIEADNTTLKTQVETLENRTTQIENLIRDALNPLIINIRKEFNDKIITMDNAIKKMREDDEQYQLDNKVQFETIKYDQLERDERYKDIAEKFDHDTNHIRDTLNELNTNVRSEFNNMGTKVKDTFTQMSNQINDQFDDVRQEMTNTDAALEKEIGKRERGFNGLYKRVKSGELETMINRLAHEQMRKDLTAYQTNNDFRIDDIELQQKDYIKRETLDDDIRDIASTQNTWLHDWLEKLVTTLKNSLSNTKNDIEQTANNKFTTKKELDAIHNTLKQQLADITLRLNQLNIKIPAVNPQPVPTNINQLQTKITELEKQLQNIHNTMSSHNIDFSHLYSELETQTTLLRFLSRTELGKYLHQVNYQKFSQYDQLGPYVY